MTHTQRIKNWLTVAFAQPVGSAMESFYYDRLHNQFFSVVLFDYILLDELSSDKTTTSFSDTQASALVQRLQRIEREDDNLIDISRVSIKDRQSLMSGFISKLNQSDLTENLEVITQHLNGSSDFDFGNDVDEFLKIQWEEVKQSYLLEMANNFILLNNIDVETASILEFDSNVSITIDLTNESEKK